MGMSFIFDFELKYSTLVEVKLQPNGHNVPRAAVMICSMQIYIFIEIWTGGQLLLVIPDVWRISYFRLRPLSRFARQAEPLLHGIPMDGSLACDFCCALLLHLWGYHENTLF